jgi:hypothetical protein
MQPNAEVVPGPSPSGLARYGPQQTVLGKPPLPPLIPVCAMILPICIYDLEGSSLGKEKLPYHDSS